MFPLLLNAFFYLSVTLASTLSAPQSISLQSSNTTGNLHLPGLSCSIIYGYGEDMPIRSCRDALSDMDRSVHWKQYISRQQNPDSLQSNQILLPIRYLSGDGRCAIDTALQPSSPGDATSGDLLYLGAKRIIDECVVGSGRGGLISVDSRNSVMKVIVRSYEPTVNCESGVQQIPPRYKDCQEVLQRFPASIRQYLFSTEEQHNPPGKT